MARGSEAVKTVAQRLDSHIGPEDRLNQFRQAALDHQSSLELHRPPS
ncbi:hypothetical protein STAFG_4831 [Streptomyces afghaniensis 772]|uniref:Uncharacterized protein n=1 Tax=Streptomyces afghaniensis 772 TaxID=1283301 RepID=S4MRD1_9ACTN|nr:hypothetical protein STAFG_4831 [Streptomyces afghaniensis 772]